jgi:hypothetical protein
MPLTMISHCRLIDHDRRIRRNDLIPHGLGEDHPQGRQCPPYRDGTPTRLGEVGNPGIDVRAANVGELHSPEIRWGDVLADIPRIGGCCGGFHVPLQTFWQAGCEGMIGV